jgi:serine phosphatase RsbU (regulator of sigma subunit)
MSATARMLAVCDLLAEDRGHLDVSAVLQSSAQQLARLTRADAGFVIAEGPRGPVVGSYPRRVSAGFVRGLLEGGALATTDRIVGRFGMAGSTSGVVAVTGPIDGAFSALDEWLLAVVARRVEARLELAEMHRQALADAAVVRDAAVAGELQRALMPRQSCAVGPVEAAGRLRPARHVGGDMYDVIRSENHLVAMVADVAGKGAPAALLTASFHAAAAHAVAAIGPNPVQILAAIDREIGPLLDRTGRIVTAAVASLDPWSGTVRLANGGHHPVVARLRGAAHLIPPGSPPLGVGPFTIEETTIDVMPGDLVLLASDGIVDQRAAGGGVFGIDRLLETVQGMADLPAAGGVETVFSAVTRFAAGAAQDDDQTALLLAVKETP